MLQSRNLDYLDGADWTWKTTSFCSMDASWILTLADALEADVDLIYDGIGGDVLSAGLFLTAERLQLFRSGRLRDLADALLHDKREAPVFTGQARGLLRRSVAIERCVREWSGTLTHPTPSAPFSSGIERAVISRRTASYSWVVRGQ